VIIDKKRAPYIKQAFELYATGLYSIKNITDILNKKGFRTKSDKKVYKSTMERILKNPFYYGIMKHNEEFFRRIF
jgi:hypothetical protein